MLLVCKTFHFLFGSCGANLSLGVSLWWKLFLHHEIPSVVMSWLSLKMLKMMSSKTNTIMWPAGAILASITIYWESAQTQILISEPLSQDKWWWWWQNYCKQEVSNKEIILQALSRWQRQDKIISGVEQVNH